MITARRKEIQELVNRLALLKVSRSGVKALTVAYKVYQRHLMVTGVPPEGYKVLEQESASSSLSSSSTDRFL